MRYEPHPDWTAMWAIFPDCDKAWVPEYHAFRLEAPANDDWPDGTVVA